MLGTKTPNIFLWKESMKQSSQLPRLSPAQYRLNSAESWPKTPFIHELGAIDMVHNRGVLQGSKICIRWGTSCDTSYASSSLTASTQAIPNVFFSFLSSIMKSSAPYSCKIGRGLGQKGTTCLVARENFVHQFTILQTSVSFGKFTKKPFHFICYFILTAFTQSYS